MLCTKEEERPQINLKKSDYTKVKVTLEELCLV